MLHCVFTAEELEAEFGDVIPASNKPAPAAAAAQEEGEAPGEEEEAPAQAEDEAAPGQGEETQQQADGQTDEQAEGQAAEQAAEQDTHQQAATDNATPGTSAESTYKLAFSESGDDKGGKEQSAFLVDTILNKMDAKTSRKLITTKMHTGKVT